MSKAILIMDDPMFCFNCPLAKSRKHNITKEERWYCGIGHSDEYGDCVYEPADMDSETKPDWCPLKPVPKKIDVPDFNDAVKARNENAEEVGIYMYNRGLYRGHNACIDEILSK